MYSARPRLIVPDPDAAIRYYEAALGAVASDREVIDGIVVNARLRAGTAVFTLAAEVEDWGLLAPASIGGSAMLVTLDVDDAPALGQRMVEQGGEVVIPIGERPYGRCEGRIRDPFGHLWIPSHPIAGSDGPTRETSVRRLVADLPMRDRERLVDFYRDVLGLELLMDQGWVVTFGSSTNPSVQVTFLDHDSTASEPPVLSVEVDDLDEVHRRVVEGGQRIAHERTVEEWGVERFFVEDPAGNIINVLRHAKPASPE